MRRNPFRPAKLSHSEPVSYWGGGPIENLASQVGKGCGAIAFQVVYKENKLFSELSFHHTLLWSHPMPKLFHAYFSSRRDLTHAKFW